MALTRPALTWRGTDPVTQPTPMGHEYVGVVDLFYQHRVDPDVPDVRERAI